MIAAHHPLVGAERVSGRTGHDLRNARRHLCRLAGAARCHPRPVRRAGHRLHRISRPGAASGRGPGHLSADHGNADRAEIAGGARVLLLRRLLRLRDFRGRHRPLLGAVAGARIFELCRAASSGGRDPEPRPRRDRRRLGLPIRGARSRRRALPSFAPFKTGSFALAWPRPEASPKLRASAASSSSTASSSIRAGFRLSASRCRKFAMSSVTAIWTWAAGRLKSRRPNLPCAAAATSRPSPTSSRSWSRATAACRFC